MAKILFTTKNMTGLLNPCLEIARRLRDDGHEVSFLGAPGARRAIVAHGFKHVPIKQDRDAIAMVDAAKDQPRWRQLKAGWIERRRLDRFEEVLGAIRDESPDLLLHDIEMHATIIATANLDIPALITVPWCSVYRDSSVAPMHTATDPQADRFGLKGRRDWLALIAQRVWTQDIVRRFQPSGVLGRRTTPYRYHIIDRRVLERLARKHRFPLRRHATQLNWLLPHMYTHLPVVSTVMREFDLPQQTPPNFTYVGPMVRREPADVALSDHDRATVDQAFAAADEPGRYLVYFSVGTRSADTFTIAAKVIEAFANDPHAVLLLSLGNFKKLADFDAELAPNVFAVDYSPQLEVLSHADLAIIHGGIGTINQCIDQQVPMVVHMFGDVDQPGCALRVQHHGLGKRLDLITEPSSDIRSLADAVRTDDSIRKNLAVFNTAANAYRSGRIVEDIVNDLLESSPTA